jgi:hypothetical protein
VLAFFFDIAFIDPLTSPGATFLILAVPTILALYGTREAMARLARNDLLRVVFPPLILIVAVLGSILGGITNPTPAAALGAAGAIMLAAYRKLKEENGKSKIVIWASFAIVIMILLGVNFDLRISREVVPFEDWVAYVWRRSPITSPSSGSCSPAGCCSARTSSAPWCGRRRRSRRWSSPS